jgi:hypothetical protein
MLHNEHLRKADESYEVRHDNNGNAIHVYITDGEAIVFGSLHELVQYVYFGDPDIKRYYILEEDLDKLYNSPAYDIHNLQPMLRRLTSRKTRLEEAKAETLEFTHKGKEYRIVFIVEEPDFWFTVNGLDIHYCEDYNDICVYEEGVVSESIFSRKINNDGK